MGDISATLVSNSTQLDNVDLMGGPRVFTVTSVTVHEGAEQVMSIGLLEYGRPWKPGLTMRRLLAEMYGSDDDNWIGKRVRLFRDDTVSFGKSRTGGTRISHGSHLTKTITVTLPISKGKFGEFRVEPLIESQQPTSKPDPSKAIEWFASQDVTVANLEAHLSKPVAEWDADDLATLKRDQAELVGGAS